MVIDGPDRRPCPFRDLFHGGGRNALFAVQRKGRFDSRRRVSSALSARCFNRYDLRFIARPQFSRIIFIEYMLD